MNTKVIIELNDQMISRALKNHKWYNLEPLGKPSRAGFSNLNFNKLPRLKRLQIRGEDSGLYYFHALFEDLHEVSLKHYGGPDRDGDTNYFEHLHKDKGLAEFEYRLPNGGNRTLKLYGNGDEVRPYLAQLVAFGTYSGLRSEPTEYSFEDIKKL